MLTTDTVPQQNLTQHLCSWLTVEIRMYPHTLTCMSLSLPVESQRVSIHKLRKQIKEYFVGFLLLLLNWDTPFGRNSQERERDLKESMNVRTGTKTQNLSF